ncbi:hypothetical protein ACKTEK_07795 [Tepidamorphus sp. 3E244]|uniref:hypothetical protein n=1 Tax=Tepidamorphus sp. 3E244 TaxID=3385498 RepID=UPI0038FCFEBE
MTTPTADASANSAQPSATGATPPPAYSKAPGVSAAVSAALLQIQETGSAFNRDDTRLMHIRGVSEQDRQRFAEIVQDAAKNGGYDDPLGYVGSLSKADIGVLQRVHSLAEPRGVTGVKSEEGAFNLLLPQSQQVDTNNDAIVERGMAKGFVFPPPNSPQGVKDAWEAATADMSGSERMMAVAPFLSLSIGANIELDDSGKVVGVHEPGEAGYKNVFGTTSAEWTEMLADMIEGSRSMEAIDPLYIERTKLLESFAANITEVV